MDSVGKILLADVWLLYSEYCSLYLMTPWPRTQAGQLHLVDSVGKIPLVDRCLAVLLYSEYCSVYLMTPWPRSQAGRLHLVDSVGKVPLADAWL